MFARYWGSSFNVRWVWDNSRTMFGAFVGLIECLNHRTRASIACLGTLVLDSNQWPKIGRVVSRGDACMSVTVAQKWPTLSSSLVQRAIVSCNVGSWNHTVFDPYLVGTRSCMVILWRRSLSRLNHVHQYIMLLLTLMAVSLMSESGRLLQNAGVLKSFFVWMRYTEVAKSTRQMRRCCRIWCHDCFWLGFLVFCYDNNLRRLCPYFDRTCVWASTELNCLVVHIMAILYWPRFKPFTAISVLFVYVSFMM